MWVISCRFLSIEFESALEMSSSRQDMEKVDVKAAEKCILAFCNRLFSD